MKKDKDFVSDLLSMEQVATNFKVEKKFKTSVVDFMKERYAEKVPANADWEKLTEVLPCLGDGYEFDKMRNSAGDAWLKNRLRRTCPKEEKVCPPAVQTRLHELYNNHYGLKQRRMVEPCASFLTTDLMQNADPKTLVESPPNCPLALIDFSRSEQVVWSISQISIFFESILDISKSPTMVIVVFVHPGTLLHNVEGALIGLERGKKRKVHREYGSYVRDSGCLPGQLWSGAAQSIIFAGISREERVDWVSIFKKSQCYGYAFSEELDRDFSSDCIESYDAKVRAMTEKGPPDSGRFLRYLSESAPIYSMVSSSKGGHVNPDSKPARIIRRIVDAFSLEGDTVFDFFSGGQGLKAALMSRRECIAFADTEKEWQFLPLYAKLLVQSFQREKLSGLNVFIEAG